MTPALQPDQTYCGQYRVALPGGETRVVCARGELLRDAAGQPTHMRGIVQDVTEREQARAALAQRVRDLPSIRALGAAANLRLSLEETIRLALEKIVTLADLGMAKLFLLRENRMYEAGVRFGEFELGTQSHFFHAGGMSVRVGRTGRAACICGDIENDERCSRTYCLAQGLRSVVVLPLCSGDTMIGAPALGSVTQDAFADRLIFLKTASLSLPAGLSPFGACGRPGDPTGICGQSRQ